MYIKTFNKKSNGKTYAYQYLVQSYRVGKKVTNRLLTPLGNPQDKHSAAAYIESLHKGNGFSHVVSAKLYALPLAINQIMEKTLALPLILKQVLPESLTLNVSLLTKLMIIGRIINPDSKLSLTRWYQHLYLPEKLPKVIDVHSFYYTLDYLMEHKEAIEKHLFTNLKKFGHIDATVVFYDLTSSYFEGEDVPMAQYGYSRDHRPDLLQITLGLVIDKNGLPIYHEVLPGNTQDATTVDGILKKLKETFQISQVIFVADKGMLTPDNLTALEKKEYQSILSESIRSALSQKQRETLFLQIQTDNFTKLADNLWYIKTKDKTSTDIIICYNQYTAEKAQQTRQERIKKVASWIRAVKEKHSEATVSNAVGAKALERQKVRDQILSKLVTTRTRKYFDTKDKGSSIADLFPTKEEVMKREEYMDGMWVVRSNTNNLTTEQLITTYKDLKTIEASFRVIKDVIELRPIYHHKDKRVRGHIFICILAFLVTRLLEQKTGQTIKMLREEYMTSVIVPEGNHTEVSLPILQKLSVAM